MASFSIVSRSSLDACAERPRWYGSPAGMKITRSRRKASASSVASRRCPKWTGSKVPPKRPRAAKLVAHLPVAQHDPLLRREAFEPHRAARMELVGGDADLGAQAVLEAVGEARGGVHHHRARVHLAQEGLGVRPVLGDDRVGVLRAVARDVLD